VGLPACERGLLLLPLLQLLLLELLPHLQLLLLELLPE
jgi:hypothetical protein